MFDVTAEALHFRAINDKGQEIDSGAIVAKTFAEKPTTIAAPSVGNFQLYLR